MMKTKNIFAVSFIAMLAVSVANATIVTQENVVGTGGVSVNVPASGQTNAGKVVVDGSAFVQTAGNTANKAVITNSSGNITTGTITSAMITNKTITSDDIADSTIAKGKLATGVQTSLGLADTALQAADIAGKQNIQIGAAKSGTTASTDSGKAVVVDENGKIAMSSATLKAVATSGSYNDLSNKPTIPTVNNKTITIQKNGTDVDSFTTNASANKAINITVSKSDVGLGNVDNTSDANKPISTATQTALNGKQDKLDATASTGNIKGTNGVTVQTPTTGDDAGKVVVSGPTLATVATSGSYNDLSNKPAINNATLTIQKNGTTVKTFTANASSNVTANITVPTQPGDIGAAAASHSHNTGEVTVATGYAQPSTASAVAEGDTVTAAIGKLEKQIAGKQASGNYVAANSAITASGTTNKIVQYDSKGLVVAGTTAGALATKSTISNSDVASGAAIADSKIARTGTITSGNTNIPTGGAVYTAVNAKADKATTLAGYGITDAYTKTQTDTALEAKQNIQIGAAKSGSTASTDSGKAVVVDDDGKIAMSDNKLGSAAYTASSAYATSAQGGKADTALQSVTANNNAGVVTNVAKSGTAITMTKAKVKSADIADDAAIAKTQLASTVQASLDLADAAAAGTNKVNGAPLSNAETYFYGTSSTAAATAQKDVSIPSITELKTGQFIVVKPTVTSTVANSTIKLNSFTAYPMRYNNAAITTSTDSVVWSANILSIFLFDGTYWQFVGHGIDNNSTYSALSGAELTGTGTTGRLITGAQYGAKQDALGYTPENVANKVTSDGYNDYVDSETRYPSMATTDAMIANAKLGLQTDIGKKIDKVVAADKQTVMVRDSGGNYVKGTGNDISVSQTGGITVNHATNATSANSIPSGAENATTYATIWVE